MLESYEPTSARDLNVSCYELADSLINDLRVSNGLEFMPPEQRLALIRELSKDVPFEEG